MFHEMRSRAARGLSGQVAWHQIGARAHPAAPATHYFEVTTNPAHLHHLRTSRLRRRSLELQRKAQLPVGENHAVMHRAWTIRLQRAVPALARFIAGSMLSSPIPQLIPVAAFMSLTITSREVTPSV